jgi:hypothetical protein
MLEANLPGQAQESLPYSGAARATSAREEKIKFFMSSVKKKISQLLFI